MRKIIGVKYSDGSIEIFPKRVNPRFYVENSLPLRVMHDATLIVDLETMHIVKNRKGLLGNMDLLEANDIFHFLLPVEIAAIRYKGREHDEEMDIESCSSL